jgi:Amt family ammonium transporter
MSVNVSDPAALALIIQQQTDGINNGWLLLTGALVFFMKAGFAFLEAGNVKKDHIEEVIAKNLIDTCITALAWYALGFSWFAGNSGAFIGTGSYFGNFTPSFTNAYWFFEFAFCAAAAAIVSGAMSARTRLESYFIFTFIMSSLIYPTVAHWVWNPNGWLALSGTSYFLGEGFIDFAGSGVVHTCGGFAGITGAYLVGARKGRFTTDANGKTVPTENFFTKSTIQIVCNSLSIFILWFGWYGFNPGSTLLLVGTAGQAVASRAAVNTTLAPATAGIVGLIFSKLISKNHKYSFDASMNCMLAGLAAITGGCAVVDSGFAVLIGGVAAFAYFGASYFVLNVLHIDDPLDAFAVHGAGGVWGVLSTGFLVNSDHKFAAYNVVVTSLGTQLAVQIIGVIAIIAWSCGCAAVIFLAMNGVFGKLGYNYLYYEPSLVKEPEQKPDAEMKAV